MQGKYVYHRVPADMKGTVLYPLNQIKDMYFDVWDKAMHKYRDPNQAPEGKINRLYLLERKVPLLNCLWNDVLHCLPVDPRIVYPIIRAAGADESYKDMLFYKIPVKLLGSSVCYQFSYRQATLKQMVDDTEWLDVKKHLPYEKVSSKTVEFYEDSFKKGRDPILWPHIPHVLVHAPIDISGCEIVNWSDAG